MDKWINITSKGNFAIKWTSEELKGENLNKLL